MAKRSKVFESFADAVADIPDGASIAFGGFAYPGVPFNLIAFGERALEPGNARKSCAKAAGL